MGAIMSKNGKTALMVAGAGFVVCFAARLVTILFFTDMNTGFLNHGSEILCNLLIYGSLAAAAIAAGVLLRKEPAGVKPSEKGCLVIGFVSFSSLPENSRANIAKNSARKIISNTSARYSGTAAITIRFINT